MDTTTKEYINAGINLRKEFIHANSNARSIITNKVSNSVSTLQRNGLNNNAAYELEHWTGLQVDPDVSINDADWNKFTSNE